MLRGLWPLGVSFGLPLALSKCPTNGLNALRMRHLSKPPNVCVANFGEGLFRGQLGSKLLTEYVVAYMGQASGEWRVGRGEARLRQIDHSRLWDTIDNGKAKGMIKFEPLSKDEPKKSRGIQFSENDATAYEHPDEYHAVSDALKTIGDGPFLISTAAGKSIKATFRYAGGYDHDVLGGVVTQMDTKRGYKAVLYDEMDGANWDSTMQQPTMEQEVRVYEFLGLRAAVGARRAMGAVSAKMSVPHNAQHKRHIRYVTQYKRMSGKWNTTVGNVIVAMEIRYWVLKQLPDHLAPAEVECLFLGDDYLAAYWFEQDVDPVAMHDALDYYDSKCGITPERGVFRSILDTTFISLGIWKTFDGTLAVAPHPGRQLRKLMWTTSCADSKRRREEIASSIAEAFFPIYNGFEMMQSFLKVHHTRPGASASVDWYTKFMYTKRNKNIDWVGGFAYKYGLPIKALPKRIPQPSSHAIICQHPFVTIVQEIESLDPGQRPRHVGRV